MRIAILVLCHKNSDQINFLLNSINHPSIDVFVHVDKKSTLSINKEKNVYLLKNEKRVNVVWADFSQVEATLNLIEEARTINRYDYYFLCSGQDLPIKPIREFVSFLEKKNGISFINFFESKNYLLNKLNNHDKCNSLYYPQWMFGRENWKRIIRRLYVEVTGGYNHTFAIFKRKLKGVDFYFGSQWWCLHSNVIEWMISYIQNNPDYIRYYRNCSTPDESFFQTLFMLSPYSSLREDYLHYIKWQDGSNSPDILTQSNYVDMINSKKLFARKFDFNIDRKIADDLKIQE